MEINRLMFVSDVVTEEDIIIVGERRMNNMYYRIIQLIDKAELLL
jgi:hypothetical protein